MKKMVVSKCTLEPNKCYNKVKMKQHKLKIDNLRIEQKRSQVTSDKWCSRGLALLIVGLALLAGYQTVKLEKLEEKCQQQIIRSKL